MNEYKNEWLQHDITQALVKFLKSEIEDIKEAWVNGAFTDTSAEGTAQQNSRALGRVQEASDILDYILSKEETNKE